MYQSLSKRTCTLLFIFNLLTIAHAVSHSAWAETWICSRPGQSDLYTDRSGPGCRQLVEAKTYSPVTISPTPHSLQSSISPPPGAVNSPPRLQGKKPVPFPEVSLS